MELTEFGDGLDVKCEGTNQDDSHFMGLSSWVNDGSFVEIAVLLVSPFSRLAWLTLPSACLYSDVTFTSRPSPTSLKPHLLSISLYAVLFSIRLIPVLHILILFTNFLYCLLEWTCYESIYFCLFCSLVFDSLCLKRSLAHNR